MPDRSTQTSTADAAAPLLSVSIKAMYLWRRAGTIAFVRIGKAGIRYTRTDLDTFIAARREGRAADDPH